MACVDDDKELVIRLTLVRPGIRLLQPSIRLQVANTSGTYSDIKMKSIQEGHSVLPPTCLTIRHTIDETSPLHSKNDGQTNISCVLCSVTATESMTGASVH